MKNVINGTVLDDVLKAPEALDYEINGLEGNDLLIGNAGNDLLTGGIGSDTYEFSRGFGQDVIVDWNDKEPQDNGKDIIKITDMSADEFEIQRNGYDLVLQVKDSDDKITISNYFVDGRYRVDAIEFGNDVVWDRAYIMNHPIVVRGTDEDEKLFGISSTIFHDTIFGNGGNDSIMGFDGDDHLYGGDGNDYLLGGIGDDTLNGDAGNDKLHGGVGNDIYEFHRGFGQDIVLESTKNDEVDLGTDKIVFKDISSHEIEIQREGYDLVLQVKDSTDKINISNYFSEGRYRIELIEFEDGVMWDKDYITKQPIVVQGTSGNDKLFGLSSNMFSDTLYGNDGNDSLLGFDGEDNLYGGDGNDILYGGNGNDKLYGGAGNDKLYGGTGSDVYTFYRGFGEDTVIDWDKKDPVDGGKDVMKFKDIASTEIELVRDGNHLVLQVLDRTDKVSIHNYFEAGAYRVEYIEFSDDVVWNADDIVKQPIAMHGTDGNDKMYGLSSDLFRDIIYGGAGDDVLMGFKGDDILIGGSGNDTLYGGDGNDTYKFAKGFGNDRIIDWIASEPMDKGIDVVEFGDIASDEVAVSRNANNLVIQVIGSEDVLSVENYFKYDRYKIDAFKFSDGVVWDRPLTLLAQEAANFVPGTAVHDRMNLEQEKSSAELMLAGASL